MDLKRKKKGFTIVELVIVIAVIGVLAAILIPTFVGLVNKANVAADSTLVRELNNALALDLADKGETKYSTMNDALEATDRYGFNVAKIDAKASKNKILWDSENGVFCYLKDGKLEYVPNSVKEGDQLQKTSYKLWIIANDVDATYSTYLYKATKTEFETSKGFDAGNEEVTSVTYLHSTEPVQTVTIRTNSSNTELVIDAEHDTVKHYGFVGKVHVVAVDPDNCYEENGKAAFTQVDSGKYKTTATADVELLFVSSASSVSLELATGTVDHAHAISEEDAEAINNTTPGVTFDYDGNSDQATLEDVYHHVQEADQLGFTATYDTNTAKPVVAEVVDKLAGEEVAADPNAENYVARIGTKGYMTFDEAYDEAENGNTIVLLKNIVLGEVIEGNFVQEEWHTSFDFDKAGITLDLNGKSLVCNATDNYLIAFYVKPGADLTIKDSVGGGIIRAPRAIRVIHCYGTINIYGGTIEAQYYDSYGGSEALRVDGTANIYGGCISSVSAYYYGGEYGHIFNFSLNNCGVTNIYGGTFTCNYKDEALNGIANSGSLYIMENITAQGLYWTNDNSAVAQTIISVAEGKTLTVDGAYTLNPANSKPIVLNGNAVYTDDEGQVVELYTQYE